MEVFLVGSASLLFSIVGVIAVLVHQEIKLGKLEK